MTLSATEAEYVDLGEGVKEALFTGAIFWVGLFGLGWVGCGLN